MLCQRHQWTVYREFNCKQNDGTHVIKVSALTLTTKINYNSFIITATSQMICLSMQYDQCTLWLALVLLATFCVTFESPCGTSAPHVLHPSLSVTSSSSSHRPPPHLSSVSSCSSSSARLRPVCISLSQSCCVSPCRATPVDAL